MCEATKSFWTPEVQTIDTALKSWYSVLIKACPQAWLSIATLQGNDPTARCSFLHCMQLAGVVLVGMLLPGLARGVVDPMHVGP